MKRTRILLALALGLVVALTTAASADDRPSGPSPAELIGTWGNGRGATYTFNADATVLVRVKDLRIHGKYLHSDGTVAIVYPEYDLVEVVSLSRIHPESRASLRSTILATNVPGSKPGDAVSLVRLMERVPEGE